MMDKEVINYAFEITKKLHSWLNNDNFMEEQSKDNFKLIKDQIDHINGCLKNEIPGAVFHIGEFVHKCPYEKEKLITNVVEIKSRSFVEPRGWVYEIGYKIIDQKTAKITSGGGSCWWDESDFKKITDPLLLLIIKKHQLENEKNKMDREINQIKNNLDKLNYALNVVSSL